MKRVLIAVSAAVLLAGCGAGDESQPAATTTTATSPAAESTATGQSTTGSAGGGSAMAVNEEVRSACQSAVTERLAGAAFPGRGTLRAASTEGGRVYTVSGSAEAEGATHPYTCEVSVTADGVTVDAATVDGQ